jgi:hypothetical protein
MTPAAFKTKWAKFSGKESAAYAEHFIEMVAGMMGHVARLQRLSNVGSDYPGLRSQGSLQPGL